MKGYIGNFIFLMITINMIEIELAWILLILSLDFYLKHRILIKKKFKKVEEIIIKKPDVFHVRHKGHWEKIADELEKTLEN